MLLQLELEGKSSYTKRNVEKFLSVLSKNADLDNPNQVLLYIATKDVANATKEGLCYAYRKYCRYYNIEAEVPILPTRIKANQSSIKRKT